MNTHVTLNTDYQKKLNHVLITARHPYQKRWIAKKLGYNWDVTPKNHHNIYYIGINTDKESMIIYNSGGIVIK